ncbi:MAG: hypothetical protein ACXWLB_13510 [Reyranella sp.]
MVKGVNVQVKEASDEWLAAIRVQLAAAPPPPPARKPGEWLSARPAEWPADPTLQRLDQLIKALADTSSIPEGVDTVERLARQMKECQTIALELESKHNFSSIKIALGKQSSIDFSKIRGCIQLASRYYDRLAFYKTDDGKKYLKGVVSVKLDLDREGDVAVRAHHFDERIDPLAALRRWNYTDVYLPWASKHTKADSDPIEHIVEFLIAQSDSSSELSNFILDSSPQQARLHATDRVGDSLTVEVRTHVAGDEKFSSARGAPRMWTYQVKVPTQNRSEPGKSELGSWQWTCDVWSDNAFSVPILRVVHTVPGPSSRRGISDDFTRGTLYAMRGPSEMRCYPSIKFHTALFDSEVTSAAGMLVAEEGRVVAIDNRSGHYQPGYRQLQTAVQFLHSNLLFEPDAFVSVHVTESEALYFSPVDFLTAAQCGMNFSVVADSVARSAQQSGRGLPVAKRYADLIPAVLRDFPIHQGRNLWDQMLAKYYGGDRGLEAIVADFKAALKPAGTKWVMGRRDGTPGTKPATARREVDHASLASQTLQAIESGGAYCNLPELLRQLLAATRPTGGPIGEAKEQNSLIQANHRYRDIARRLAALKPDRKPF